MPVCNVQSQWVDGNLVFYDKDGNIIVTYDGTNRKLTLPSGSTLESLGTTTITDGSLSADDLALTTGSILLGASNKAAALDMKADGAILIGNGSTAAAKVTSGDAKIANDGAITIQAKAVENTMIAAAAGTVLVGTKTSGDVTALDISAEGAMVLGQGAGETPAAYAMSGDVTMTKAGATTIGATKVTSGMLANGAGIAAVVTAGLGNSAAYTKATDGAQTLVAANATKGRGTLVMAVVDEAFADNGGSQTTVAIGETGTTDKGMATTVFTDAAKGAIFFAGFTNTANKDIIATVTKATGEGTGGVSVTVLALPNS